MKVVLIWLLQISLLFCQYTIQDVHFDNFQDEQKFKSSLKKWKSMDPRLQIYGMPPLWINCQISSQYLVLIHETSNKLQWITPSPKIPPTEMPQAFYSFSLEADFILIVTDGYQPQTQLIMHLNTTQITIFNTTSWNASYNNRFGNLCQGPAYNYISQSYSGIFPFSSPVLITLETQGDGMDGIYGIQGMFSIKNLIIRYAYCHQSCSACTGPGINDCTECSAGSILSEGNCLCMDISICICPKDRCVYILKSYPISIFNGDTFGTFGFVNTITSTQVTHSENYCLQFVLNQAYRFSLPPILSIQSYMFVATYKILIINPQIGFQLQFQYGMVNQKAILSYSNSHYMFSNLDQYKVIQDVEPYTDSIEISQIFGIQAPTNNIKIQGTFMSSGASWLLCSISIREIGCQTNCKQCLSEYLCGKCLPEYNLYKGTCLTQCPPGYTPQQSTCQLDIQDLTILPRNIQYLNQVYSLASFMFFDFETTSDQAQSAFVLTSAENYPLVHSVMSNDASYSRRVFGGMFTFGNVVFKREFPITQPNYGAIVQFIFYGIDQYSNLINGFICYDAQCYTMQDRQAKQESSFNIIGQTDYEKIHQYQFTFGFTIRTSITVQIICESSMLEGDLAFCALSDFLIMILECQDLCKSCTDASSCNDPIQIVPCQDRQQLSQDRQSCIDIPILGCIQTLNSICQLCDTNLAIINFTCQSTPGYYLNEIQIGSCDQSCLTCSGPQASQCTTCSDGFLLIQSICQECKLGCETCLCYTCPTGQLLILNNCFPTINMISTDRLIYQVASLGWNKLNDQITYKLITLSQFCGNSIQEDNEQCDDGNLLPFDGCDEHCIFQCHQVCQNCINGQCSQCQYGWKVQNGSCTVISNDGYIVLGYEECDDGNTIPYDGCHNSIYQCQPQCSDCQQGICQYCSFGLLFNHICYDCELPCQTCDSIKCFTCQMGWYPIDNYCYTQCGDGIVAGIEQCDSSINCVNCVYELPINCISMTKGICTLCSTGYELDLQSNCMAICGDGIIQHGEQCDDGNLKNYDGCSSECQAEFAQNYEAPYIILKQLFSDQPNIQIIQIQFSQLLSYITNLTAQELYDISIVNTSQSIYDIQISEIDTYFTYQVTITFHQTQQQPVLSVKLLYDLKSQNNMHLQQNFKLIILQPQYYYSQTELQNLSASSDSLKYLIYMIMGLCIITYMLGKQRVFYNFLDILQRCSYLQYLNIGFPYSLQYFFQIFNNVSLNYVFDMLGISINNITFPYYQSTGIFERNNYNALLLANIFSTILFLTILIIIYTIGQITYSTILYGLTAKFIEKDLSIPKIHIHITQIIWSAIRLMKAINFREILNSMCYDNTISVLLYLNQIQINSDIYNTISLILMVIILTYLSYDFIHTWTFLGLIFQRCQKNLIEINSTNIWSCQYQALFYLKKIAFCINLVCIQSNANFQIVFSIILTLTNLMLICVLKPFDNKQENIKLVIEESIMLIIYISLLSFITEMSPFTIEQQNQIAWLDIALFITCMAALLFIDIYSLIFIEFYESLKKLIRQVQQYINSLQART